MYFVEPFWGVTGPGGTGRRVFNVNIENGQAVENNIDLNAEVTPGAALIKQYNNVLVNDGFLNINFTSITDNALISAIEVTTGSASLEFADFPNSLQVETGTSGSIGNFINTSNATDPVVATLNAVEVGTSKCPKLVESK